MIPTPERIQEVVDHIATLKPERVSEDPQGAALIAYMFLRLEPMFDKTAEALITEAEEKCINEDNAARCN